MPADNQTVWPPIVIRKARNSIERAIGRAVIGDDDLERMIGLNESAVDRRIKVFDLIVTGH